MDVQSPDDLKPESWVLGRDKMGMEEEHWVGPEMVQEGIVAGMELERRGCGSTKVSQCERKANFITPSHCARDSSRVRMKGIEQPSNLLL